MRKLSSEEIKKIELNILLEFKKICDDNNLRFNLSGGTLLGAVRHKGFIPWDDDIDVCMPRPDYEKLFEISKDSNGMLNEHLELASCVNGKNDYPYAKIFDTRTHLNQKYRNDGNSLWIDIMPVDGLPEDFEATKNIYKKVKRYRDLLALCNANPKEGKTKFKKFFKRFVIPFVKIRGAKYYCNQIEKIAKAIPYGSTQYVGAITWGLYGPKGEKMRIDEYQEKALVDFEGYKMPTYSCYKNYLTNMYGDYMQLPPVEKRVTHDMEAYIDE
ncbi:LicD family protein [Sharpea azabuensis]|uniref:LicD family protein n=1 Tax=Sharpea azabuensis TaxID=322505 RepID=UPI00156C4FDA|nr:LicD family protein [Sharpea azabuensis]